MSKIIAIDTEVFYSSKLKYSLRNQIAEQFCRSDLFDCYMVSASDGKNCWAGSPKDFNWASLEGATLLSHNAYWDITCIQELQRRGIVPHFKYAAWHCTANLTSYLCNRRSLDQSVEHLLGIKLDKSARSDANGKNWPADFSESERKIMLDYARNDAFYCWTLFDKFGAQWPDKERQLSKLTIDQGMRGVQINRELLDEQLLATFDMKAATEKVLPWLAESEADEWEEFTTKPTSTKCIAEQCRRTGIPCPPVKSDDEEGYEEWETTYAPFHNWIRAVGAWRSINKLLQTLKTVKDRLRVDGTLPFGLKYFGAHTGRWSGDSRVNLQNMRKKPAFMNEVGLMETDEVRIEAAIKCKRQTGTYPEWVKASVDFRNLITPRPGYRMIVSDLSQIEPRVLAWLTGNKGLLELMGSGMSPYEAFARVSMGWTGGILKDENPDMYALAKAQILALGYGAGWEKFIQMALDYTGVDITADDPEFIDEMDLVSGEVKQTSGYGQRSRQIVADFREQNEHIPGFWRQLEDGLRSSVGSDFIMGLPNGRKMRYEKVRAESRIEPDKKTGKPRKRTVYTADSDGRRKMTYGGKLTENITQAVARDVFAEQLLSLLAAGFGILFTAHDEAIVEVPLDREGSVADVRCIMSQTPSWMPGLPVACDAKEVPFYTK